MGWHWGILASSGGAAGSFDLLETTVLGSAATVTFTGLGSYSDYKHLQLRMVTRSNSTTNNINITFNSSTTGYAWHRLWGNSSSVQSGNSTNENSIQLSQVLTPSDHTANAFSSQVIDILDFSSSSKNTTIRALGGNHSSSGGGTSFLIGLFSGLWNNTAAVTSISLTVSGGNFAANSRFSLYGVK